MDNISNQLKTFLEAKKLKIESEIESHNQEIILYNKHIDDRNQTIANLKLSIIGYADALDELNKMLRDDVSNSKFQTSFNKICADDILIEPFEFDQDKLISFKSIKLYIDDMTHRIASIYLNAKYYSTVENILKIPYPFQAHTFELTTWHNNNRTAVKLIREYIADTQYDPDHGMYRKGFNDSNTKVAKQKIDVI